MVAARQDSTLDFPLRSSTVPHSHYSLARCKGDQARGHSRRCRILETSNSTRQGLAVHFQSSHGAAARPRAFYTGCSLLFRHWVWEASGVRSVNVAWMICIRYEVRGARDARSHQALKFMRALVFGLDLRGHRSWTLDGMVTIDSQTTAI